MRGAAAALLLLVSAAAPAAEPKSTPTKSSANGLYAIRLQQVGDKKCRIQVMKDRDVAWQMDKCLGTVDDLLFINNDGSRFWVLSVVPEIPERAAGAKTDPVFEATVAAEYDKDGRLLASRKLKDFLEYKRRGLVRKLEKHFKWLEGVLDVPGKSPRVSDAELLELEPVGGKTQQLRF